MVGHAGRRRDCLGKVGEVRAAPDPFQGPGVLEVVGEGHQIDDLVLLSQQRDHGLEDPAVLWEIKLVRADDLESLVERLVVEEDGPKHGFLSFEILRRQSDRSGIRGVWQAAGLHRRPPRCARRVRTAASRLRTPLACSRPPGAARSCKSRSRSNANPVEGTSCPNRPIR